MYSSTKSYTISEGCPWYKEQQAYGPPNVNWCEPTQCAIINEPANAWTNLGIILAGFIILQKINSEKDRFLREFGWIIIIMGIFSFIYHSTNNYFSQFFDFLGMYLMTSVPLAFQSQRIRGGNPRLYYSWFWFYVLIQTCLFWCLTFWGVAVQFTIILPVLGILILEIFARKKEGKLSEMKYFWITAFVMFLAQTASQLDIKRIYCVEENILFHGHAIWHLLSGLGMIFLAKHMKQVLKDYNQWR